MPKTYFYKRTPKLSIKLWSQVGLRFGCGYLPHWRTNPYAPTPRMVILWFGPWLFAVGFPKPGYPKYEREF